MRENFNRSLDVTLGYEGGYVNHPKDPGGATNKGVTLATLRRWKPGASVADLKAISTDMLRRIYRDGYWDEVNGDTLAAGVDLAVFDYAVNSGPAAALKSLRAVVGGAAVDTVKKLCARRLTIYRTFKHWRDFGNGWTRRVVNVEAKGVAWALAALTAISTEEVKTTLRETGEDASKQATREATQAGGAVVATGGGGVVTAPTGPAPVDQVPIDQVTDPTAAWLVFGAVLAIGIVAVVILLRRAAINNQRAEAYAAEAEATGAA